MLTLLYSKSLCVLLLSTPFEMIKETTPFQIPFVFRSTPQIQSKKRRTAEDFMIKEITLRSALNFVHMKSIWTLVPVIHTVKIIGWGPHPLNGWIWPRGVWPPWIRTMMRSCAMPLREKGDMSFISAQQVQHTYRCWWPTCCNHFTCGDVKSDRISFQCSSEMHCLCNGPQMVWSSAKSFGKWAGI